jgi:hypothetical protein
VQKGRLSLGRGFESRPAHNQKYVSVAPLQLGLAHRPSTDRFALDGTTFVIAEAWFVV